MIEGGNEKMGMKEEEEAYEEKEAQPYLRPIIPGHASTTQYTRLDNHEYR